MMVYCFTRTTDWAEWLRIKEAFAYEIKNVVEQAGSGFAFPSQSIYVESWPAGEEAYPLPRDASAAGATQKPVTAPAKPTPGASVAES